MGAVKAALIEEVERLIAERGYADCEGAFEGIMRELTEMPAPGDPVTWAWHSSIDGSDGVSVGVVKTRRWQPGHGQCFWVTCEIAACPCHDTQSHMILEPALREGVILPGTQPRGALF